MRHQPEWSSSVACSHATEEKRIMCDLIAAGLHAQQQGEKVQT